ncbi:hypothetical protein KDX27_24055 [Burkholderia cenocepacia]|uniref:hypothetical protein n=1 Tax=Burkholderia cenocepacia TaxID=95486 RepID=UPI00196A22D2|nr:hypothetical protein [Burkholderia cenocepacia]MBN3533624.1 hypothetical protein [Burkholderia cenocepacia]MBR7902132.1 hypothetical protein [Burkholderia cenocepacia]MBR8024339.1 hypothetical protein [Burkholderia cenocepacia]MBR8170807.1 hypothetical protein [Burkholderia cenocepacia]MBR8424300.1 hypothetical protein [Burkholderia cenocepacia]
MALAHRFLLIAGASAALMAGADATDVAAAAPVATTASACTSPSFDHYPAPAAARAPRKPAATPRLTSKEARLYRTVIRDEFAQPANFAGHYRVAIWGCGTDCRNFAIVDKDTGATYTMPGVKSISGVMGNDDERVDFRAGSTLLIVAGCFNDACDDSYAKAARFFYEWTGSRLRPVGRCPLAIEPVQ